MMCFALPEILRPGNKNLALWLSQEVKENNVESCGSKKAMPTDNLSTWLNTRYIANQTKKSSVVSKASTAARNLDMWLAETKRKLEAVDSQNRAIDSAQISVPIQEVRIQPLSSWLATTAASSNEQVKQSEVEIQSLSSWLATTAVSNESMSDMEQDATGKEITRKMSSLTLNKEDVSEWLHQDAKTATSMDTDEDMSDWLVYSTPSNSVAKTHHRSGFPMPQCHDLPAADWLAPGPETPVDAKFKALDLNTDNQKTMIRSWLEDNEFKDDEPFVEEEDEGLDQWLMVQSAGSKPITSQPSVVCSGSIADDDHSSIIVLEEDVKEQDEVASNFSWKFVY